MPSHRLVRIFISSPNDVADERASAIRVIEQLQHEPWINDEIKLESVSWDKPGSETPLSARVTPQEAIIQMMPKPSDCHIVVVILWYTYGYPITSRF